MKNEMCSYSNTDNKTFRTNTWYRPTRKVLAAKPKRVRCPECGRSMTSALRTDADGSCIFHCIPPHKIKGWWKKPKKRSKDIRMKKMGVN